MKLPRCLANSDLLAWLSAMDEQFRSSGGTGSFGIRWHYAEGELRVVKIEAPEQTFVMAPVEPTVRVALRAVANAAGRRNTLTVGD